MPHDEFYCEKCETEVTLTVSIAEREHGGYKCPVEARRASRSWARSFPRHRGKP